MVALRAVMVVAAAVASVAVVAVPAAAGVGSPADFSFTFDTKRPGVAADADLYILYKDPENPDDPEGRSPALTRVVISAPRGTVFDTSAVRSCAASDGELMLLGRKACPPQTEVGAGSASVVNEAGPANEFPAAVTLFNYDEGIIELLEFLRGGVKVVDRARLVRPHKMVLHPAVVPGITEREFRFDYEGTPAAAVRPYITTPPRCPRTGVWISRLTYTVTTGDTYTVTHRQPCRKPSIRAIVKPRRVRAGNQVRVRVRLRSSRKRCVVGATVRLGGRRARTTRAGRATIRKRFGRPGRRLLTATKRGCRGGKARLTVVRAR